MREIKKIIIHCSDSDYQYHDNIGTIKRWHTEEKGFNEIGYHFVIVKSGKVFNGRSIYNKGAHCKGHNENSIGICLTGKYVFSDDQKSTLRKLIIALMRRFDLNINDVFGHNEFDDNKTCPNFDINETLEKIANGKHSTYTEN